MVTVTIPGVLAVLAILGHEHAVAGTTAVSAAGMADESAVGPLPLAPASTVPAVRNAVATVQRTSGGPVTVYSDQAASQQARAMHLLVLAAAAGQATSYQGVEETRQLGVNGTVTVLSQVWHQGGGLTLIRTMSGATPVVSYDTGDRSPAGVFGVTSAQVTLLGKHYVAAYRGAGTASGLPATIVEVYRFDGSLAARFWLDTRTMVPLRREDFDTADKLVSDDLFTQVRFGPLTERPDRRDGREPGPGVFAGLGLGRRQFPRHAGRAAGRAGRPVAGHRAGGPAPVRGGRGAGPGPAR